MLFEVALTAKRTDYYPMNAHSCSIFFHNYYGRHEEWIKFFSQNLTVPFNLYYNIVSDSIYNLADSYSLTEQTSQPLPASNLKQIIFRKSPNQGKDIGGKLVLLEAYLHLQQTSDYIIFLHDKKSPHQVLGSQWSEKLFTIIKDTFTDKAIDLFNNSPETGIIAGSESIQNEYNHDTGDFFSNNNARIKELQNIFSIDTTNYSYVAGTMFWARSAPLQKFFTKYNPLEVRKLFEKGNIMDENKGSNTHAWERLLCWIITAQGYSIKGI